MTKREIVIPLYDHTSDEEIRDILDDLKRIGLDDSFVRLPNGKRWIDQNA